jgi:mannitol-specific phosphotransferase system IIBC component
MKMKASAIIIGMIAGTFGLSGGADVHEIRGALVVAAATVGMVGAAFSISKQRTASTTMILASIVGAIASSTFWFSTILFGIAALFAFLGRNPTRATHQDD